MKLKLRYDPQADRMRLILQPDDAPMRVFWLNRNQALAAMLELSQVATKLGLAPTKLLPLAAPPVRPKRDPTVDSVVPEVLSALRGRQKGERIELLLVQLERATAFGFKAEGLKEFLDNLALQCERAGWDPAAGLKRLRAMAQARAAIGKSKSEPAPD
jgi:hypothetical protein